MTFEILTPEKINIVFLWVITPCSCVRGYRYLGGNCCFHLPEDEKLNGALTQHTTTINKSQSI
jgi:hypothetical protein